MLWAYVAVALFCWPFWIYSGPLSDRRNPGSLTWTSCAFCPLSSQNPKMDSAATMLTLLYRFSSPWSTPHSLCVVWFHFWCFWASKSQPLSTYSATLATDSYSSSHFSSIEVFSPTAYSVYISSYSPPLSIQTWPPYSSFCVINWGSCRFYSSSAHFSYLFCVLSLYWCFDLW